MSTSDPCHASPVSIVPYRRQYRGDFERLNRIWLEGHSLLEAADLEYLMDPEGRILAPGGQVFFAIADDRVLGTAAVIPERSGVMELAKLAVDPVARGRGIGKQLTLATLEFARERGAHTVVLTSNSALTTAIRLYESLGFEHAPLPSDVRYQTADVFMRLSISPRMLGSTRDLANLLPRASEWAQTMEDHVLAHGIALSRTATRLAREVGVQQVERVRLLIVDRVPDPEDPELRNAAIRLGLLTAGTIGLTLGHAVFLKRGHESEDRLLKHELRHVHQYEVAGSIQAFLSTYLQQIAEHGYAMAPYELDARAHE